MVIGSLHYVHDLASFDRVRSQTRDGTFPGYHSLMGRQPIPVTGEEATQILSYTDQTSMYNSIENEDSDARPQVNRHAKPG